MLNTASPSCRGGPLCHAGPTQHRDFFGHDSYCATVILSQEQELNDVEALHQVPVAPPSHASGPARIAFFSFLSSEIEYTRQQDAACITSN